MRKVGATEVVKCRDCIRWDLTKRYCTNAIHGECDCPKCQGLCECENDDTRSRWDNAGGR